MKFYAHKWLYGEQVLSRMVFPNVLSRTVRFPSYYEHSIAILYFLAINVEIKKYLSQRKPNL